MIPVMESIHKPLFTYIATLQNTLGGQYTDCTYVASCQMLVS